jgi:hypothetical protein
VMHKQTDAQTQSGALVVPTKEGTCRHYFERMAARRWTQLANNGDYLARRIVADRTLQGRMPFQRNVTKVVAVVVLFIVPIFMRLYIYCALRVLLTNTHAYAIPSIAVGRSDLRLGSRAR